MQFQKELDKSKPFATIMGDTGDGTRYEQNGIGFDALGKRVTPPTDEEFAAIEDADTAAALLAEAERKREAAIYQAARRAAKKAEEEREPEPEKELPEGFDTWTREDMLNYARNKFGRELKGSNINIRKQLERLL